MRDITHAEELRELAQEAQDPSCDWGRIYDRSRDIVGLHPGKSLMPLQQDVDRVFSALFRNPACDIDQVLRQVWKSSYRFLDTNFYSSRNFYEDIGSNEICSLWLDAQDDLFMDFMKDSGQRCLYANLVLAVHKFDKRNTESLSDRFEGLRESIEHLQFPSDFGSYFKENTSGNGWNSRLIYEVDYIGLRSVPAYNNWWNSSSFAILLYHGLGLKDQEGLLPPLAFMFQDPG